MIRHVKLYGTTDATGALTVTGDVAIEGLLHSVEWIDGTFADGVDAVISLVRDDDASDITLLTLTDANIDKIYYPLVLACNNTGADLATAGDATYQRMIINGKPKLVVASGGAAKVGGCIVYYEV